MKSVIEEDLTLEGDLKSNEGIVEVKGKVVGNVAAASIVLHLSKKIKVLRRPVETAPQLGHSTSFC